MAVRIENAEDINFGTFAAAATVTHIRIRRASDDGQPLVRALASPVAVGNGNEFQIDIGRLDVLYPSADLGINRAQSDAHMQALVESYWGAGASLEMEVDAMTDATTPVAVSGYSQQAVSAWTLTTEADPAP